MSALPTLTLPAVERISDRHALHSWLWLLLALIGLVFSVLGAVIDPVQFAHSWLWAFFVWFPIVIGMLFWILLHFICDSQWSVLLRRTLENIACTAPVLFLVLLPLLLVPECRDSLWKWTGPIGVSDPELSDRALYLNLVFFYVRAALYFLFFFGVALFYRSLSVRQDTDGSPVHTYRLRWWSYFLMLIWALLVTFSFFDWWMGLDYHWSSSLFGVYGFTVCAQSSLAAAIVFLAVLRGLGYLGVAHAEHYHLMGKLLFGFTIFWAYIAFGQYWLDWYANIPEETIFYNDHNRGTWPYLSWLLIVGKFMFPVIYLLSAELKKHLSTLTFVAGWILLMHAAEMFWFIGPYLHRYTLGVSWQDPVALLTVTSLVVFTYVRIAATASLFPVRDPRLAECLTIQN